MREPPGFVWQPGEKAAIACVIALADIHGYGNLISRLKTAWDEKAPIPGLSYHQCPWCRVDDRTGAVPPKPAKKRKASRK